MPRRNLPSRQEIPWSELRRQAQLVYGWLRAGWDALSADEREQARKLLVKSKGRINRLSKEEARVLGKIAGRAASAAAAHRNKR
jgi:hypothetical protein